MNTEIAIEILEILASGCSPITGEVVENDSVLNERDVIRALQIAIDHLKKESLDQYPAKIAIDDIDLKAAIALFKEEQRKVTTTNMVGFFLGTRNFTSANIVSNPLYGKFSKSYTKGQLLDFFNQYLPQKQPIGKPRSQNSPYKEIDFFQKERFNLLSENAVKQLKDKINELGVLKTENLSPQVENARISFPRAYEYWSSKEIELLSKAIKYTNDLDILSECFQRGKGSIESYGQQIIYESQALKD